MPAARIIQRAALRRALRRMLNDADFAPHHEAIRATARNLDQLTELQTRIEQHARSFGDEGGPGPERPLLRWLWDHRQEILQFILQIVELFRGK